MKNTATSYSLPPLAKTTSLAKTPSNLFKKPTLNRIFYSPLPNKQTKENYNCVMLQSCVGNVSLESFRKDMMTYSTKIMKKKSELDCNRAKMAVVKS